VRPFVFYGLENNIDANSRLLDEWLTTDVQDKSYKANKYINSLEQQPSLSGPDKLGNCTGLE
jgi:hypothetical protein